MKSQHVDLLISHHQIFLRSGAYLDHLTQWGKGNLTQGMILHSNFVIFDPIVEGSFGANVNLFLKRKFSMDDNAQRAVAVPFYINKVEQVFIGSVAEEFLVDLPLLPGSYLLNFEICVKDEVYYNFSFVENTTPEAKVLINDEFGLNTSKLIKYGIF